MRPMSIDLGKNAAGQPVSFTDPMNNTGQLGYDGGDLVSGTDQLGNTVRFFKNSAGQFSRLTDTLGQSVGYEYNALDRPTIAFARE